MKKTSNITNEDLAMMINKQDERFVVQDGKLEHLAIVMEKRFEQQDQKIETLFEKYTGMLVRTLAHQDEKNEAQERGINDRFDGIDEHFTKIHHDIWNLDEKFVTKSEFQKFTIKKGLV